MTSTPNADYAPLVGDRVRCNYDGRVGVVVDIEYRQQGVPTLIVDIGGWTHGEYRSTVTLIERAQIDGSGVRS